MERSRIFLSWSGERSRKIANRLAAWLEDVLQTVEPFMSDTDIAAGDVWFDQIGSNLESSRFAIICVTPENANSKWLHFEAGAIGMVRDENGRGSVVPYCHGLSTTDLSPPLSLFQAVNADKQGTFRMIQALNSRLPVRITVDRLERTFEMWWPKLESVIAAIPEVTSDHETSSERPDRELLEELLSLVRAPTTRSSSSLMPSDLSRYKDSESVEMRMRLRAVKRLTDATLDLPSSKYQLTHRGGHLFSLLFVGSDAVERDLQLRVAELVSEGLGDDAVVEIDSEPF